MFLFAQTLLAQSNLLLLMEDTAPVSGSHITDNLQLYWVLDSLANGDVEDWYDAIANYRLATPGGSPTKSATDLTFDGTDYLRGTTGGGSIPNFTGSPMTLYAIVDLQDTATTQFICGAARGNEVSFYIESNRLVAYAFDGTDAYHANAFSTPFLGKHVITAVFSGSATPVIYLDGVLTADVGTAGSQAIADTRAFIGGDGINNVVANTTIPLMMVYNVAHNLTQINQNVNSTTFQSLLP